MTLRYEGARFSDGSCAVRRVAADPCERTTLTFESLRELEEDIGSADVSWIVDRGSGSTKPPSPPSSALETLTRFGQEQASRLRDIRPVSATTCPPSVSHRVATIVGDPPRPAYVGDGHPAVRAARYQPTEEVDEP